MLIKYCNNRSFSSSIVLCLSIVSASVSAWVSAAASAWAAFWFIPFHSIAFGAQAIWAWNAFVYKAGETRLQSAHKFRDNRRGHNSRYFRGTIQLKLTQFSSSKTTQLIKDFQSMRQELLCDLWSVICVCTCVCVLHSNLSFEQASDCIHLYCKSKENMELQLVRVRHKSYILRVKLLFLWMSP